MHLKIDVVKYLQIARMMTCLADNKSCSKCV